MEFVRIIVKKCKKNVFCQISTELCQKCEKKHKKRKIRKLIKNAIMHAKTRSHFSKVSTDSKQFSLYSCIMQLLDPGCVPIFTEQSVVIRSIGTNL